MTDRPILFGAPMVRALFDGRKTQTRRLATSPLRRVEVGDRLWVRETFTEGYDLDDGNCRIGEMRIFYAATECPRWLDADTDEMMDQPKWTPSIFMRRIASRLTLTVTGKRTEPLIWIDAADARAEGLEHLRLAPGSIHYGDAAGGTFAYAIHAYASLWNGLHKKPGARWDDNPDVIALTFTVEQRNIDR